MVGTSIESLASIIALCEGEGMPSYNSTLLSADDYYHGGCGVIGKGSCHFFLSRYSHDYDPRYDFACHDFYSILLALVMARSISY